MHIDNAKLSFDEFSDGFPIDGDIMQRLALILGTTTDADMSRVLGISPNLIANSRRKGALPCKIVAYVCYTYDIPLDLIISIPFNTFKSWWSSGHIQLRKIPQINTADPNILVPESLMEHAIGHFYLRMDTLQSLGALGDKLIIAQNVADAMSPTIPYKSHMLVSLSKSRPLNNKIFAIGVGDMIIVARIQVDGIDTFRITFDNPGVDSFRASRKDVTVYGQVIQVLIDT